MDGQDWTVGLLARLEREGWSDLKITQAGGPSADTLRKMKAGGYARRGSWDKLRVALDELRGNDPGQVEVEVTRIVVRGSVASADEISRLVAVIRQALANGDEDTTQREGQEQ